MQNIRTARALAALTFGLVAFGAGCGEKQPVEPGDDGGGAYFPPVDADKYGINVDSDPRGGLVTCEDLRNGDEVVPAEDDLRTPSQLLMLRPSDYRVTVSLPDHRPATRDVMESELALGEAVAVNLELVSMPDGECCVVHVTTAVEGAAVDVDIKDRWDIITPADVQLPRGMHHFAADLSGFRTKSQDRNVQSDITVDIPLGRDISGRWVPREGPNGELRDLTMDTSGETVMACGFHVLLCVSIVGNTLSYDGDESLVEGRISEDGRTIEYIRTSSGEGPFHYRLERP